MIACALFEPFALWHAVKEKPELRDKALVTLKRDKIRAVSKRASELGVAVGMSRQGAHSRCADLHVIETDDVTLRNAWGEVLGELYSFTDSVESPGPGLVFLDIAQKDISLIADRFEVRVGVGSSQEEAHLKALNQGNVDKAPVAALERIGLTPKSVQRLEWLGIKEVGQLRRWSKAQLSRYLGEEATTLSRYLKGPFTTTVARYTPAVTLTESYAFEDAVTEPYEILPVLEHLSSCLAGELGDRAAARLSVTAEASGIRFSSSRRGKEPLHGRKIYALAQLALRDCGVLGLALDRLSIELSGLHRPSQQGALWRQRENIEKAKERVHARFPGAILELKIVNPYMPVGKLAYSFVSPGGERLGHQDERPGGRRQRRERQTDAHQRQPSHAGD